MSRRAYEIDSTKRGAALRRLREDCNTCGFDVTDRQMLLLGMLTEEQIDTVGELVSKARFGSWGTASSKRSKLSD